MRKFRFRLQKVLRLREQRENLAALALAEAEAAARFVRDKIAQIEKLRDSCVASLRDSLEPAVRRAGEVYLEVLRHEKIALELNLAEAQNKVEARRAELVEAQRDRKAMMNLRDHQASLHAKELAKLEQKELDALGTDRAARGLIGL